MLDNYHFVRLLEYVLLQSTVLYKSNEKLCYQMKVYLNVTIQDYETQSVIRGCI